MPISRTLAYKQNASPTATSTHVARGAMVMLLLWLWAISLPHLTVIPLVYEDEPWQASTGWKLAQQGIFGSDLFADYYGMETHYYGYMPLYPLWLALIFRLAGIGLFQDRIAAVFLAMLGLGLTYSLGKKVASREVGLGAVVFLLFVRTLGATPSQVSGILWLDMARISRYDLGVPVLGMAALSAYLVGLQKRDKLIWFFLAGLLAALSGLTHLYGLFWIIALFGLALWQRLGWQPWLVLGTAVCLPLLPYLIYTQQAPSDWLAQTAGYTPRFDLLNPSWYLSNLVREGQRYGPGLGSPGLHYLRRPSFWLALLCVPVGYATLGWQLFLTKEKRLQCLWATAVLLPLLFALLIYLKLANYLVTIYPLMALVTAWAMHFWWRRLSSARWRTMLVLALCLVLLEGIWHAGDFQRAAQHTTPYGLFLQDVRAYVPDEARLLGLHHYWLGFVDLPYQSWFVPVMQAGGDGFSTLTWPEALDRSDPTVILIDRRMRLYFEDYPGQAQQLQQWQSEHGFALAGVVEDDSYGRMEIYVRR